MKRNLLLLAAMPVVLSGVLSLSVSADVTGVVRTEAEVCHSDHNEGRESGHPFRLADRNKATRGLEDFQQVRYEEPAGLFTMGYTPNLSFYSHVARRGSAYKEHTWKNISNGFSPDLTTFQWIYDSPDGPGQGETMKRTSEETLTLSYPFNWGWWQAPSLLATVSGVDLSYAPDIIYRFGGPSAITFPEGSLDFGMTPYSQMLYKDANGKRTTTFGSLKYLPSVKDPYSVEKWTPVLTDKNDLKMKGFYNIFHKPDAPYTITRIWGYIEYTALKESTLTMKLYKLDSSGQPTDEIIAEGEKTVKAGSDKSLLFDLRRPGEQGGSPIAIDCAFMAVLEGFAEEGAFSKVLPILGSGTVWDGEGECPWPHNCGVLLSWKEGDVEKQDYFYDSKIYDEGKGSTKKLCACDFLWMVDGSFPWLFEKSGASEVEFGLAGGTGNVEFDSWYSFGDPDVKICCDADWITVTADPATDPASVNTLKLSVSPSDSPREGYVTVSGPAVNCTLAVRQSDSSGVTGVAEEVSVVKTEYFDITGCKLSEKPVKGLVIKVDVCSNGERKVSRLMF
ncbi:MAG: BACON domain-containing protein [Muribaculaceae bacterium]|nr:BACON domain-containing protein [Muribaculaceae bacterium]